MQILNLFSAFSMSPNLLVINNGLLYVSNINKTKYLQILTDKALSTSIDKVCSSEYKKYPAPKNKVSKTI